MQMLEPTVVPAETLESLSAKETSRVVAALRNLNAEAIPRRLSALFHPKGRSCESALNGIIAGSRDSVADVLASINAGTFKQTGSPVEEESEAGLSEWL